MGIFDADNTRGKQLHDFFSRFFAVLNNSCGTSGRGGLLQQTRFDRIVDRVKDDINRRADGLHRRGVQISTLIQAEIERAEDVSLASGTLSITFYRDDLVKIGPRPVVGESVLPPGGVDEKTVVIVDDVLHTGRTARAALNELSDWGRPARVLLCVLVDRGDREVPIQPDVVGKHVDILPNQEVMVLVPELDGRLGVDVITVAGEET